jgi:hypothetical protein
VTISITEDKRNHSVVKGKNGGGAVASISPASKRRIDAQLLDQFMAELVVLLWTIEQDKSLDSKTKRFSSLKEWSTLRYGTDIETRLQILGSAGIVNVDECKIVDHEYNEDVKAVRQYTYDWVVERYGDPAELLQLFNLGLKGSIKTRRGKLKSSVGEPLKEAFQELGLEVLQGSEELDYIVYPEVGDWFLVVSIAPSKQVRGTKDAEHLVAEMRRASRKPELVGRTEQWGLLVGVSLSPRAQEELEELDVQGLALRGLAGLKRWLDRCVDNEEPQKVTDNPDVLFEGSGLLDVELAIEEAEGVI